MFLGPKGSAFARLAISNFRRSSSSSRSRRKHEKQSLGSTLPSAEMHPQLSNPSRPNPIPRSLHTHSHKPKKLRP